MFISAIVLFLLTILFQQEVERIDRKECLYNETSFFSTLTAGFKKFIGHECWNEADVYLHQGLTHEEDKDEGELETDTHDSHDNTHEKDYDLCSKEHHAAKPNPLLPYNRSDFVHTRHVKPLDDKEILPWFKMSVYMDPKMTKAYVCGGYWLAWRLKKPKDAIEFLEEGVINNPNAPDILAELGMIYFDADGRLGTRNLSQAVSYFNKAMESEQFELRKIQLLTYRSESFALLGEFKNAIDDLDMKIALMAQNKMEGMGRLQNAVRRREVIADKIDAKEKKRNDTQ